MRPKLTKLNEVQMHLLYAARYAGVNKKSVLTQLYFAKGKLEEAIAEAL